MVTSLEIRVNLNKYINRGGGGGGGGGGNAILGYFRPYLSRAICGFSRCTWPKIALKLKQVNICSSN